LGKLISKTNVFRPNLHHLEKYTIYESTNYEIKCFIKKSFTNHWLCRDIEYEFLALAKNSWDCHPVNFVNPDKIYTVVADSLKTI
jgi:hypothetical protein